MTQAHKKNLMRFYTPETPTPLELTLIILGTRKLLAARPTGEFCVEVAKAYEKALKNYHILTGEAFEDALEQTGKQPFQVVDMLNRGI